MKTLNLLKEIEPRFHYVEESPIIGKNGQELGWHSVFYSEDHYPLSGGTSKDRNLARRIAIAECLERGMIQTIPQLNRSKDFLLDEFPTTCGFAFGFERDSSKMRSIFEAVERWARSKWIDEEYFIERIHVNKQELSPLGQHFFNQFDDVIFLNKVFEIEVEEIGRIKLQMGITLGIKSDGIFSGQRVGLDVDDIWEHSLLESWRHLHIYEKSHTKDHDLFSKRIAYFGRNKKEALSKVEKSYKRNWPRPILKIIKEVNNTKNDINYFLWRSICEDYLSWDNGSEKRFVY